MSAIEWTDQTWNPVRGCSRISPGCEHCYAEGQAHRFSGPGMPYEGLTVLGKKGPRWNGTVRTVPAMLEKPLRWRKPRRVFVNSMSDLFHESVPDPFIAAVFGVMAAAPRHTFQVLTKRPQRAAEWFARVGREAAEEGPYDPPTPEGALAMYNARRFCAHPRLRSGTDPEWPLPNVWLGVSVEDQQTADQRIPWLLECPAAVRWVSHEPALGPVDFRSWLPRSLADASRFRYLDWIVVGGEAGHRARPFDLAWARSTIAQCREARVPVFVKQLGADPFSRNAAGGRDQHRVGHGGIYIRHRKGADMDEWPGDLRVREWPS